MSHLSEINYRRIALQLLQTGKSTDEVIAQLVKLDLEEYSARALIHHMFVDAKVPWRTPAIIGSTLLIIGSIFLYNAIIGETSTANPLASMSIMIRILGFGLLGYSLYK